MKILLHGLLWLWCSQALAAPALWSATRDNQQLWLFGSIHLADQRLSQLPPALTQALAQSQLLLLEVDPEQISAEQLAPFLTMSANESWSARLGDGLASELKRAAREQGMGQLGRFPPWFAALQLTQAKTRSLGFHAQWGIDFQLHKKARQQGLPIQGLESPTLVFEMLSRLPTLGLEDEFVRHSLDEMAQMPTHLETLLTAWQRGDEQALQDLLVQQQSPELSRFIEQQLLAHRNQLWLDQLASQPAPKVLIVVGALHLYGEQGLLAGLAERGFNLDKIEDDTLY
ncbi:TraB/GumN family protein [Zobellella maritima]|uniref:TraB/GumN family protein n=1 Tax=Zobellella maritima TaxID=2059725 RepID=UPI000E3047C2|nr:TraB/GumN family protein [Zobellella maritima]